MALGVCIFVIPSCTIVKHYPKTTPFIFENTVNINGKVDKDKKGELKDALLEQIEDSAKVRSNTELPWPKFPFVIPGPVIKKPNVFDSVHVLQSTINMHYFLRNKGYRSNEVKFDSSMKIKGDQYRVKVNYTVEAGNIYRLNKVVFALSDSNLQRITLENAKNSLLKPGDPMDYSKVNEEINRLVALYQNNGYVKITREEIYIDADSSFKELIDPSIDQFEYLRRLAEIEQKYKNNPQVDLYIKQRVLRDTTRVIPYRIGQVIVYADAPAEFSLASRDTTQTEVNGYRVVSFNNTFRPTFITRFIELKPGELYKQENYSQTLNNFNRLGVWSTINIISRVNDSSQTIDYLLRLTPSKKQFFSVDLEGSSVLNTNQLTLVGVGKVGLAVNFRLKNRNIGKRAIQLENTLRTGIEFNDPTKIVSSEISLTNRFIIPWLMTPFSPSFEKRFKSARTIVSFDFSYIDRFQYFLLKTFNTFFGYEWKTRPEITWQFKPANIEYTKIKPDSLFEAAIRDFPLLRYSYNNGLIIGTNGSYSRTFNPPSSKHINSVRIYAEESGLLAGAVLGNLTQKGNVLQDLYRFVKMDVDFRHYIKFKKTAIVLRAFAGYGYAFQTESSPENVTLPFFKSYFAGGPNSMRGWQIRKLGIGSNIFFDTLGLAKGTPGAFNDKYADIQLELNAEYRFNLFRIFGFWLRGAAFTDMGNIWYRRNLSATVPDAVFRFNNLYKDLAISPGFGVRVDFTYFVIRFDLGYPIKDPRFGPDKDPITGFYSPRKDGWFVDNHWNKSTLQFAIGYPF
jgi:outer membrane protein insertion porin family